MRYRLTTRDKLRRWGLQVSDVCLLCNSAEEIRFHLFFRCNFARQVWNFFFSYSRLNLPTSLDTVLAWVRKASSNTKLNVICKLVLQAAISELWRERNVRLHNSVSKSTDRVIRDIQTLMRQKLAGLDKRVCVTQVKTTSSTTDLSYLYLWFGYIQIPNHPAPWSIHFSPTRLW